jgi:hypothetical protein
VYVNEEGCEQNENGCKNSMFFHSKSEQKLTMNKAYDICQSISEDHILPEIGNACTLKTALKIMESSK